MNERSIGEEEEEEDGMGEKGSHEASCFCLPAREGAWMQATEGA
jgi:hypothetical protein